MAYTDEFGNIFGSSEDFNFFGDAAGEIFYNTADTPWTAGDVFDWGGANQQTILDLFNRYGKTGLQALKSAFTKPESQGGGFDWRAIAAAGGAFLPFLMGDSETRPTGYQGSIPEYTAVRQQVPGVYDPNRRPGSGGQRYFTDVQYVPRSGEGAAEAMTAAQQGATEQAQGLAALNLQNRPPAPAAPPAPPPAVAAPAAPAMNPAYSGESVLNTVQSLLAASNRLAKGGIVGLQDGGFVVPADVVSHLGNGSSDAGLQHLQKRGAVPLRGRGDGMSDSNRTMINNRQPAAVAHEEAYFGPREVKDMGGAQNLYAMMDQIRKDRTGTTKQGRQINPNKYLG